MGRLLNPTGKVTTPSRPHLVYIFTIMIHGEHIGFFQSRNNTISNTVFNIYKNNLYHLLVFSLPIGWFIIVLTVVTKYDVNNSGADIQVPSRAMAIHVPLVAEQPQFTTKSHLTRLNKHWSHLNAQHSEQNRTPLWKRYLKSSKAWQSILWKFNIIIFWNTGRII